MSRLPAGGRSLAARLGLGRVLYYGWHWPRGKIRESVQAGGPVEQWRTARGRKAMAIAARTLPAPGAVSGGGALELHLLTGRKFWYQTAFCLWSFAQASGRRLKPVIYDDGTLTGEFSEPIARLFPSTRFVSQAETVAKLRDRLPASRFPALADRWEHYPNIRKLTDVHAGSSGWKLVIDSDLLFFRRPAAVIDWLEQPDRPLRAVDAITAYGYSLPLMESLASRPLTERVNVGLCGLNSGEIDWEQLEHWCRTLIERAGTHYFLEQALVAMLLAGRDCAVAPEADYVTLPRMPEAIECRAVMHHYVAESKRWYFQSNWRRVLAPNGAP